MKPLHEAVKVFEEIYQKVKSNSELQKKLRTRARSFPSFANQVGIEAGIAFLAAKAEKEGYTAALGLIEENKEIKESEKVAYGLYLYAVLKYVGKLVGNESLPSVAKENLIEAVNAVKEKPELLDLSMPYLLNFKMLAEANLEKEGE